MDIHIDTLEKYFKLNRYPASVGVDIHQPDPSLIFIKGENQDGSRRESLTFMDLRNILHLNHIIGENSLVNKELELMRTVQIDRRKREGNIEVLIYNTLSQYIIQLLQASTGEVLFKNIIPLEKHKQYFKER